MKNNYLYLAILFFLSTFFYVKCKKEANDEPIRQLQINGVASVNLPLNTLNSKNVTLVKEEDEAISDLFDEFSGLFGVNSKLNYQIRLNIGSEPPANDSIEITLNIPASFSNLIPQGSGIELFAQIYQDGGEEILDNFELIESSYNSSSKTVTALLPVWMFTNARNSDSTYEAVFMIATTPGTNLKNIIVASDDKCLASQISCPIGSCEVTSSYSKERLHPIAKKIKPHWGTDFRAAIGSSVVAAADGKIESLKTQKDANGKTVGYGLYIIVRHTDGSASLYAHLSGSSVSVNQSIKKGSKIGLSGNSGSSSGPHLHFEYVPNGQIIQSKNRIDPFPCISSSGNADGSITIRDNGNLADDAFQLYLDNILIGETSIGASNSIALSNLRPGEKMLTLKCTVAPDNVGTYEVVLGNGITFKNTGLSYYSSTLSSGGSISWSIIIPSQSSAKSSGIYYSVPNVYKEK